ncbi:Large ribosomal subunit protein uL5 OS=Streptomyces fumanus OX=67302 GN=rplE PE=3 SV=1 [Streptomyces fumanus]
MGFWSRPNRVKKHTKAVTTATGNDDEGRALLRHLGFPFKEA